MDPLEEYLAKKTSTAAVDPVGDAPLRTSTDDPLDAYIAKKSAAPVTDSRIPQGAEVDERLNVITGMPYREQVITAPEDFRPVKSGARADLTTPIENDIERRAIYNNSVQEGNRRLYESVGESGGSFLGMDLPRVQKGRDGNTYLVPQTGETSFSNVVAGSVLEAGRGVGSLLEAGTDYLGITDDTSNSFESAVPRIPATENEQIGIEIGSQVIGGLAGGVLGSMAGRAAAAKTGARFMMLAKGNPVLAQQYARAWSGAAGAVFGSNAGAAISAADSVDPVIMADIMERYGVDEDTARYLGLFSEGVIFDGAAGVIGKYAMKPLWNGAKNWYKGLKGAAPTDQEIVLNIMRDLGELDSATPGPEMLRRLSAMADTLSENGTFDNVLSKTGPSAVELDSPTAFMRGALDYVDKAYVIEKETLSPQQWAAFRTEKANAITERFLGARSTLLSDPAVRSASLRPNRNIRGILRGTSDDMVEGNPELRQEAARRLAQPEADNMNAVLSAEAEALAARDAAQQQLEATFRDDEIASRIASEMRSNPVRSGPEFDKVVRETMTGDLYRKWRASYDDYSRKFASVPEGIEVDLAPMIEDIQDLFKRTGSFDTITSTATRQDPLALMLRDMTPRRVTEMVNGKEVVREETVDEIATRLSEAGVDFRRLFNDVRPKISDSITRMYKAGNGAEAQRLAELRDVLDTTIDKVDVPEAAEAMAAFKAHKQRFESNPALEEFATLAKSMRAETGQGVSEFRERAGKEVFDRSLGSDVYFDDLLSALGDSGPNLRGTVTDRMFKEAAQSAPTGGLPSAEGIQAAAQRYGNALDPVTREKVAAAVDAIRKADNNVLSSEEALVKAQEAVKVIQARAKEIKAFEFLTTLPNSPIGEKAVTQDIDKVFAERIFQSDKPVDAVANLLRQTDDPEVRAGIKSQYLRWLDSKLYGSSQMGIDFGSETVGIARVNQGFIDGIRNDPTNSVENVVKELWADNPEQGKAVMDLLDFQSLVTTGQTLRNVYQGSNTAANMSQADSLRTAITLAFGKLNRTATTLNALTSLMTRGNKEELANLSRTLIVEMMADPDALVNAAKQVISNRQAAQFRDRLVNELTKAMARSAADPDGPPPIPGREQPISSQMMDIFGNLNPFQ